MLYTKFGGKATENSEEYCDSYREKAAIITEALGWKLWAFDPGLVFERDCGGGRMERAATLSEGAAMDIINALNKKDGD